MPPRVLASKVANALVEAAVLQPGLKTATLGVTWAVLEGFRSRFGGLWVGGRVTLTDQSLAFAPNALNRAVQKGIGPIDIPLHLIDGVAVLPGILTKIIAISATGRTVKVRCYKAPAFAEIIRTAVGVAKA